MYGDSAWKVGRLAANVSSSSSRVMSRVISRNLVLRGAQVVVAQGASIGSARNRREKLLLVTPWGTRSHRFSCSPPSSRSRDSSRGNLAGILSRECGRSRQRRKTRSSTLRESRRKTRSSSRLLQIIRNYYSKSREWLSRKDSADGFSGSEMTEREGEKERRTREDRFKRLDVTRRHPSVSLFNPVPFAIDWTIEQNDRAILERICFERGTYHPSLAWTIVHSRVPAGDVVTRATASSKRRRVTSRLQPPQHDWPNGPPSERATTEPPPSRAKPPSLSFPLDPAASLSVPFGSARHPSLSLSLSLSLSPPPLSLCLSLCRARVRHSLRRAVPCYVFAIFRFNFSFPANLLNLLSDWNERRSGRRSGRGIVVLK